MIFLSNSISLIFKLIAGVIIDAEKAYWVIRGDEAGVMTMIPQWVFAEKIDARKFLKEHGGHEATFTDALNAATLEVKKESLAVKKSDQR